MPKSQQVAKIRQILSNRGAGVDTLDLVDDLVDPTVGYEDNKREILRRVGFDTGKRYGEREMVHEQCPSAIADCATNGIDACEFACEECRDTPSCRKLTLKVEPLKKKSMYVMFKGVMKHRMRCPECGRAAQDNFCIVHSDVKALDLETSKKAQELTTKFLKSEKEHKKKVVKLTKPIKTPKVTTKPKMAKPIPVAKSKIVQKSKFHEKVLTDAQIQHARKHGYVNITIEGVKKRVSKKNFAARKRTICWYKSGGKVSLKIVRR